MSSNGSGIPYAAECLYTETEVAACLDRMAGEIEVEVGGHDPLILCVMTGAIPVTAALMLRLPFPLQLDYVHATRYRGELRGGELEWLHKPETGLRDRIVLLVDDILDEGETLAGIRDWCLEQGASRVLTAVLVDKQHERRCARLRQADFTGLMTPDRFLVGYGMDYQSYGRNAPGIYALTVADSEPVQDSS